MILCSNHGKYALIWYKEAEIIIRKNKKKHNETVKNYLEANKKLIYQQLKEKSLKREESTIKSVVSQLESINKEVLAQI
jgi:hypothetical protein